MSVNELGQISSVFLSIKISLGAFSLCCSLPDLLLQLLWSIARPASLFRTGAPFPSARPDGSSYA